MARERAQNVTIRRSVLDRLLDDDTNATRAGGFGEESALARVVRAVCRDLEDLLNTRHPWTEDPAGLTETARSIAAYGLPDFISEHLGVSAGRSRLQRAVEQAIATFEPRLRNVVVKAEPPKEHERSLHLRIDAVLWLDPLREPVTFDTELSNGTAHVVPT